VIISVDVTVILNTIRSWSIDFDDSVNWVKKFKMSFVAKFKIDNDVIMFTRFNVDNDVIMMNEAEIDFDDDVILINEVILMF